MKKQRHKVFAKSIFIFFAPAQMFFNGNDLIIHILFSNLQNDSS